MILLILKVLCWFKYSNFATSLLCLKNVIVKTYDTTKSAAHCGVDWEAKSVGVFVLMLKICVGEVLL